MKIVIEIHYRRRDSEEIALLNEIHSLLKQIKRTMPTNAELQQQHEEQRQALASIAESQTNLAGDIERLTERMEEEEVSADLLAEAKDVTSRLRSAAESLQVLAQKTPEPDIEEPDEPTPINPDEA